MTNGNNNIKCDLCDRQYKSTAALQQHKLASHKGGAARKNAAKKNVRVRKQQSGARGRSAPVSTTMNVVSRNSEGASMSGVDRLKAIEDISKFHSGELLIDVLFDPADIPRLATVARAFQKIKYKYLRFRIEPQVSSSTSGGYVASFIRDPADTPPGDSHKLLDFMTASRGSVTTKWWQQSVVNAQVGSKDYFTSLGVEVRDFSPGRFLLAVDGKSTQAGNLTVFVEWSVYLHTASYENPRDQRELAAVKRNLYTNTGDADCALWGKENGEFHGYAIAELIEGAKKGMIYALRTPIYVQASATVTRAIWYLNCTNDTQIRVAMETPTDFVKAALTTEILALKEGTELEIYKAPQVFRQPASSSQPVTRSELESISGSNICCQSLLSSSNCLQNLLQQLKIYTESLPLQKEPWPLMEPSKSTDFQPKSEDSYSMMSETDEDLGAQVVLLHPGAA